MSVKISSLNTASTINSGDDINIAGNNPLAFSDWGGGWFMQDGTWIRSYNAKSLWMNAGLIGGDGGLTIGYGGVTPPSGGAIIGGNVGIGTTSPISGQGTPLTLASSTGYVGLTLSGSGAYSHLWQLYASGDGGSNKFFGIYDSTNASYRLVATSGGNVGIGTTIPGSRLQVTATSTSTTTADNGITILNDSATAGCFAGIRLSTYGDSDGGLYPKQFIGAIRNSAGGGKGDIVFLNKDASDTSVVSASDEKMRITFGGNLLIGTTTDSGYKLEVNGSIKSQGILFEKSPYETRSIGLDSLGWYFYNNTDSRYDMLIDASGNVGIGTTNPDGTLVLAAGTNGTISVGGYLGFTTGVNNSKVRGAGIETFTTDTSNNHGLRFYTNAAASSPTIALTLADTGAATFSSSVTATHNDTPIKLNNLGGTYTQMDFLNNGTQKAAIGWNNSTTTLNFYTGVTALTLANTGAATFSSSVTANGDAYFGKQDYSIQATQKVLTLKGDAISGLYAGNSYRFYTTPGALTAAQKLSIRAEYNGTESSDLMTITGAGRVGIGTDTPSTDLDVRGSANFRGSTYLGLTLTPTATGGDIYLYEGNNPKIYLQSAGLTVFNTGYNFLIGTTTDAGYKLYVNGTGLFNGVVNSPAIMDNVGRRFISPEGATFITGTSSITGAIKIKLPVARNNSSTMMMFRVKIYQYSTGNSFELQIGGYNYGLGNWYNVFATNLTDDGSNLSVRFGTDATSDCVWIGELGSTWSYPQVFVTDFQAGYSGQDIAWATGWGISFETAFDTVEQTRLASQVITSRNIASQSVSYATTAGALTSMLISQFTNDSGYITSGALAAYLPLAGGTLTGALTIDGLLTLNLANTGVSAYHTLTRNAITTENMFKWVTNGVNKWWVGQRSKNSEDGFSIYSAAISDDILYFNPAGNATFYGSVTATNFIGAGTGLTGTASGLSIGGSAGSVAWANISGIPNEIFNYDGWVDSPGYNANTIAGNKSGFTYSNNAPYTGPLTHFAASGYGLQFNASYSGGGTGIAYRTKNGDIATWNNWYTIITSANISSYALTVAGGFDMTGSFGLNDNKLYLRTNNDANHYIWNAADDWEEIVAYFGTGLRIKSSNGSVLATFSISGNAMDITGNAATATAAQNATFLTQPNATWDARVQLGGNGSGSGVANIAVVQATDGNLHMDNGLGKEMYLNYYHNGKIYLNGGTYFISANGSQYNGNAATAGALTSMLISQFTNNSGYITSASLAGYLPLTGGNLTGIVISTANIEASAFRTDGNFELTSATTGLKSNFYDTRFYASSTNYWNITTAASATGGALLFKQGYEGTTKGYVYWDSSGFGLLTNLGDWAVRANYGGSGSGGTLFGAWSSSGSFTATQFYTNGWFRNNSNNTGLYNETNSNHFFSSSTTTWKITSSTSTVGQLAFYASGGATFKGSVYWDDEGFGLLNATAGWAVKLNQGASFGGTLSGSWLVGGNLLGDVRITGGNLYLNYNRTTTYSIITHRSSQRTGFGEEWYSGMAWNSIVSKSLYRIQFSDAASLELYEDGDLYLNGQPFNIYSATANYISVGNYGLTSVLSSVNGYFRTNNTSSYGFWDITGDKGGYTGVLYNTTNLPHMMFGTTSGNGGLYYQTGSRWITYYGYSDNCLALCGATTDSAYRLRVNGTSYFAFAATFFSGLTSSTVKSTVLTTNGIVYSLNQVLTNTNPSDIRLKEDIAPLQYGLKEVMALNPVTYKWKDGSNGGQRSTGLIAQDVQDIMPDYVKNVSEDSDLLGLDSYAINIVLINAIKELKAEIEILKNK